MQSSNHSLRLLACVFAVLLAAYCSLHALLYFGFVVDDAGISFRYGAHLFDGKGLTYNTSERVEGYSNFGYVVLSGAVYKTLTLLRGSRSHLLAIMKLVNLAAGLFSLFLCYRISRDHLGKDRWLAFLTVLLVASNGAFAIACSSPMETATYTALLTLLAYALPGYLEREPSARRNVAMTVLLFAFSVWRIDAPLLLAAGIAACLVVHRRSLKPRHAIPAGAWLLAYAAYTLFRRLYFGEFLNNPYHAKIQLETSSLALSPYTQSYFMHLGAPSWLFLVLFVLAAAIHWRRYLLPLSLVLAQWFYVAIVGGDWMPGFRFWAPLTPMIAFLLIGVIDVPFNEVPGRMQRIIKSILVLALAAWWLASSLAIYAHSGRQPAAWFRDGPRPLSQLNPYWQTAEWLNDHAERDAVVVIQEAGFVPFLTNLHCIDTYGLCNRTLARAEGTRGRLGLKPHWRTDDPATRAILAMDPDLIVLGPLAEDPPPGLIDNTFALVASPGHGMHIYTRRAP